MPPTATAAGGGDEILILDGGLGTALEREYGVVFGPATPLWSADLLVSDPATLARCQADFGRVPVDILLTATYQLSAEGLARTPSAAAQFPDGIPRDEVGRLVERAVDIAHGAVRGGKAREPGRKKSGGGGGGAEVEADGDGGGDGGDDTGGGVVALSIGPYGACMTPSTEYSGRYDGEHDSQDALYAWHRERLQLFGRVVPRVRFVALETIPRVDEIAALRRALAAAGGPFRDVRFWMACLYPGDGLCLPTGETAEAALRAMFDRATTDRVPWGVGINCTKVWKLPALLGEYERVVADLVAEGTLSGWPALVLYPDGTSEGEVYNTTTQVWERRPPGGAGAEGRSSSSSSLPWEEQLARAVRGTRARGRWKQIVVGGCCMASAGDIARLRSILR